MYDAIVIGAGPAGLQAALTLGRMHRSMLVLDSGAYRNGTVSHMHNVIGDDGTAPDEYRSRARAQLAAYVDVEFRRATAASITGAADDFTVALSDGHRESARRIILATGVADELPDVPGLDELWGQHAFACPFCDGHEFAGSQIGIIGAGPRAGHLLALLGPVVGGITVFSLDAADDDTALLEAAGARVAAGAATAVRSATRGGVIVTAAGVDTEVAGLFVAAGSFRQRAPFAEQLGTRMLASGSIEIDDFGRTSVAGVFAAGDLAHRASMPGPMASVIQSAAAGQLAASGIVQELSV
ncbi:pyridine nucleotide-disulfide oxidoreductase [Microbacterium sp. CH12i]|uniref:NAD(P)/FAD-dependent oxidoreductase n=1 Tax=Microbacterium sp. CH12i TaxID=1479651 RepID=UPI0004620350|nr:NAD(P)/FAD-dependent oxidoreductase [Microbacterium sp. CH12i]KDA04954.1 pyridine nucleotide-disulfide oxidoreductase [Microbacterium sp. CH12i]